MQSDKLTPKDGHKLPFTLIPFLAASLSLNCHSDWPDAHAGVLPYSYLCQGILWAKGNSLQGIDMGTLKLHSVCPHEGNCLQKVTRRWRFGRSTHGQIRLGDVWQHQGWLAADPILVSTLDRLTISALILCSGRKGSSAHSRPVASVPRMLEYSHLRRRWWMF
jgi:hypothetical protein